MDGIGKESGGAFRFKIQGTNNQVIFCMYALRS